MSEYTAELAHAAAARGAKWMDKRCPTWASEIDLAALDMGSGYTCVLGQTATCLIGEPGYDDPDDGFTRVVYTLWPEPGFTPERLGFERPGRASNVAYEMLTIAWREQIRQRLEARQ